MPKKKRYLVVAKYKTSNEYDAFFVTAYSRRELIEDFKRGYYWDYKPLYIFSAQEYKKARVR